MAKRPRNEALCEAFGERVRDARHRVGLSQEHLAWYAGLTRNYTGNLERGKMTPSIDTLFRVSRALGCDPCELIRGLDKMVP